MPDHRLRSCCLTCLFRFLWSDMVPYSFFYDVDDFKSTGQLFWKMSLNLGMFVFSWLYSDYTFWQKYQRHETVFFTVKHQKCSISKFSLILVKFSHLKNSCCMSASELNTLYILSNLIFHICFHSNWMGIHTTSEIKVWNLIPLSFLFQMPCFFHFIYNKGSF